MAFSCETNTTITGLAHGQLLVRGEKLRPWFGISDVAARNPRNTKVATSLLENACRWAKLQGAEGAIVPCDDANSPAVGLFSSSGFTTVGNMTVWTVV